MTTPEQSFKEIHLQLAMLNISEASLELESASRDLITLKTEIEVLEVSLDGAEPWVVEWLTKAHFKGSQLNTGAQVSYKKELADGSHFPFNTQGRAHLIERFNAWSQKTAGQVIDYESSDRTAAVVAPWIVELDQFRANPTGTY